MRLSDVDEAAETTIAQQHFHGERRSPGTGVGSQKYAVRGQLDPECDGLTADRHRRGENALQLGNTNPPTGTLYGQNTHVHHSF